MNYTRLVPFVLFIAMTLLLPTSMAKAGTKSTVGISTVYEEGAGRNVEVSLYISGSEKVAGGSLELLYDKSALSVKGDPIIGTTLSDYLTSVNAEQPGKIMLEWAKATEQTVEGTLLTLTLRLEKSNEMAHLDLQDVKLFNKSFQPIAVDAFDGEVKPFKGEKKQHGTKVKGDKEWTIRFNKEFNPATINQHSVIVRDRRGTKVDVNVSVSNNSSIVVKPKSSYTSGTYTLEITEQVRDASGKRLKEPVILEFSVE